MRSDATSGTRQPENGLSQALSAGCNFSFSQMLRHTFKHATHFTPHSYNSRTCNNSMGHYSYNQASIYNIYRIIVLPFPRQSNVIEKLASPRKPHDMEPIDNGQNPFEGASSLGPFGVMTQSANPISQHAQ